MKSTKKTKELTHQNINDYIQSMTLVEHENKTYFVVDNSAKYAEIMSTEGFNGNITQAEKNTNVVAREAIEGESLPVYTSDGRLEAQETGIEGNYILSKANPDGTIAYDKYGHSNDWQITKETLLEKYHCTEKDLDEMALGFETTLKANGQKQTFMELQQDICIQVPWGPNGENIPQYIQSGGFINITNPNDIYGIARDEFLETYNICEESQYPLETTIDTKATDIVDIYDKTQTPQREHVDTSLLPDQETPEQDQPFSF